ncbi:hypothetical protein V1511DRAFT_504930 [Dipodascopsis uninucleata]
MSFDGSTKGLSESPTRPNRGPGAEMAGARPAVAAVVSTVTVSAAGNPMRTLVESLNSDDEFVFRLHSLYEIQRTLVDKPECKDIFRLASGFESVLDSLSIIDSQSSENGFSESLELLKCVFSILSDALLDCPSNKRYLTEKVGYEYIERTVKATGLIDTSAKQVLGIFFSFLISDFSVSALFISLARGIETMTDEDIPSKDIVEFIHDRVATSFTREIVKNSFIIPLMFQVMERLLSEDTYISIASIVALICLSSSKVHNKVVLHDAGLMDWALPYIWDHKGLDNMIIEHIQILTDSLMELGVSTSTAKQFYRHAMYSEDVAKHLLDGIRKSRNAAHITFDLSLHGYSTIEISSLGRTFPPQSNGYTFSAWIKIDQYDEENHTTLFGVFDNSQKCVTLLYIEKETKKLILQTSVTSSRGSVRFKNVSFETGKWYFIAITHRRPRVTSASKACLFVDEEFVEQLKCPYPSNPPNDGIAQVFIGTPANLTSGSSSSLNKVHSVWNLSSLHIFEDVLSDDLLAVHYRLGPRYYGNYQDALGSFQTYEASAALNLRNETLHSGREDSSDIINVIRGRASNLVPESKILLSIHAKNVVEPSSHLNDYGFRQSPKSIVSLSRNHLIVVNAAVPDINMALSSVNGIAIGSGDPVPVIPKSLDDAAWRLGGSALALKMTELAKTPEQLTRAISVAFELLRENWRNSDDMERVHGFAILANVIKTKTAPGMINIDLLNIILDFVGYRFDRPEQSLIINPLAYRILLVDYDIWKNADLNTLKAYFDQFAVFGLHSIYHTFNAKRLTRMRTVKRFLQALKAGSFSREALLQFIPAFKLIIITNVSAEVMRSLSLFITYAFSKHPSSSGKRSIQDIDIVNGISRSEIGLLVLEVFAGILCDPMSTITMKKFARTVTNKWVLFLLSQDDSRALVLGMKILARLLIIHGASYVNKFASKTGGFIIIRERLKFKWYIPELWPICLAILFGVDVATLNIQNSLDLYHLVEMFRRGGKAVVVYPEMFSVIGAMLKSGALTIIIEEHKKEERAVHKVQFKDMEDSTDESTTDKQMEKKARAEDFGKYLQVLTQFFSDMHASCPAFQDFCATPIFIQEILGILFPATCNTESVSPEIELQYRESGLTFDADDIVVRPASRTGNPAQIMKSVKPQGAPDSEEHFSGRPRASSLRRGSSFVLVTSDQDVSSTAGSPETTTSTTKHSLSSTVRNANLREFKVVNRVVEGLLEMVVAVLVDQVLTRKDFSEMNISILIPPTFQEYQIYFETYIFRNTVAHLNTTISLSMRMLCETRTLNNFGKFIKQLVDSVFNGWFLGGAEPLLELIGMVVEYLQEPSVERLKSVRLCQHIIQGLRLSFMKLVLYRLSELNDLQADSTTMVTFLNRMLYWQNVLLSPAVQEDNLIKLICYMLYIQLIDENESVRDSAANNWRMVLVHKPIESSLILDQVKTTENRALSKGFKRLTELDNSSFLEWVDSNREALDGFFLDTVARDWESFVSSENKLAEENTKQRSNKRRERLRQIVMDDSHGRYVFGEHKVALLHWRRAIYTTEHLKFMRNLQDQQDNLAFLSSEYSKLEIDLVRPRGVIDNGKKQKWKLDLTEGRDRMRKRMIPDMRGNMATYLPKGEESAESISLAVSEASAELSAMSLGDDKVDEKNDEKGDDNGESSSKAVNSVSDTTGDNDDGFEIIQDPRSQEGEDDAYEDKNRKVMRSLEQGDTVVELWNVCRIIGLESVEGLLIQGKNNLYLIDNFFQRSDGEIVNLWEAPPHERDQYLQTIASNDTNKLHAVNNRQHDTRHWALDDLVSVSRRQFLFRNVALEFFFADGRSFLITTLSVKDRDHIHNKLINKVISGDGTASAAFSDELWRQALQPSLQGGFAGQLGKIANVFGTGISNLATRKWIKGEISNFYYLMLVNTMAGRTYNDLTQYPVFPWIIADYVSEELDLDDPATFRDLSKPMGAQTPDREREFRDRYQSLADLNDTTAPPFHYGTHFSSAMIVSSYLIRLEPFVQSYLLLQGGHFDHADRLFYSIEKAWQSASRDNMADVRELIPEFFYLPEFLVNSNDFKFGTLQGSGEEISSVELPPWAKGDPKIFIQKNREALESPYVSQHLHEWIDLVFGYKQRGEAAVEATNVFHHLSYHGAIDLEKIEDPLERIATIGIIHNFGQTPHQVFTRAHPPKELIKQVIFEVDTDAESLVRMLAPTMDFKPTDSITNPFRSEKEKVLAQMNPMFCAFVPPTFDRMVEWGFCDDGVRFKLIENGKLIGHVEKLHQGHLTCVKVADPRTLVTAGYDCMICVWRLQGNMKNMEVQFKASLRGHTQPIVSLAISRSFSTIVSASEDGCVLVWDLNRMRFVRELPHNSAEYKIKYVAISDETGDILTSDGQQLFLWTINGETLLVRDVPEHMKGSVGKSF